MQVFFAIFLDEEDNLGLACLCSVFFVYLGYAKQTRVNRGDRVRSMVPGNPRTREKTREKQGQGMGGLRF